MKYKIIVYSCFLSILVGCHARKNTIKTKKNPGVVLTEPLPEKLPSINQEKHVLDLKKQSKNLNDKVLNYIKKFTPIAVKEMHKHKIPASITLAQGILESNSGTSKLAKKSNNHFGIKCHSGWQGQRVYHDDDRRGECFRKYQYVATSFNDHSEFLTGRKRYAFLFNYEITAYKKWARGLKKAGYATDSKYPNKLIRIIETYKLYKFDNVSEKQETSITKDISKTTEKKACLFYVVKAGDTLYSIAKEHNIALAFLKSLNNLKSNVISIGQKLRVNSCLH